MERQYWNSTLEWDYRMAKTFLNSEYFQEPKTRKWDIKIKSNKEASSTDGIQIECFKATGEEALIVQN